MLQSAEDWKSEEIALRPAGDLLRLYANFIATIHRARVSPVW